MKKLCLKEEIVMSEVKKILANLNEQYPEWDSFVYNYYEKNEGAQNKDDETILEDFSKLIDEIIKETRQKRSTRKKTFSEFKELKCQKVIEVFVLSKLRLFWACRPIVEMEKENSYEIEQLLDVIWEQYVLRFSEDELEKRKYFLPPKEFDELCIALDGFVDNCVRRQLSSKAIYSKLETEAELSPEICTYLVEKIERDWTELKLNYIIKQM